MHLHDVLAANRGDNRDSSVLSDARCVVVASYGVPLGRPQRQHRVDSRAQSARFDLEHRALTSIEGNLVKVPVPFLQRAVHH